MKYNICYKYTHVSERLIFLNTYYLKETVIKYTCECAKYTFRYMKVETNRKNQFDVFLTVHLVQTFSNYQLNAQFLYSSTICMLLLHYDPQHVSSSTLLILRRTNCITTASSIVTLCKRPHSMQLES